MREYGDTRIWIKFNDAGNREWELWEYFAAAAIAAPLYEPILLFVLTDWWISMYLLAGEFE